MANKKRKATDVFQTRYQQRKFEEYWKQHRKSYFDTDTGKYFVEIGQKNKLKTAIAADIAGRMKKQKIKISAALIKEEHSTIFKTYESYAIENFCATIYKHAPEILKKIKSIIQMPDKRKAIDLSDFTITYNGILSRSYNAVLYHFYYEISDGYSVEFDVKMVGSSEPSFEIINIRYNGVPTTKVKGFMHGIDDKEWTL